MANMFYILAGFCMWLGFIGYGYINFLSAVLFFLCAFV